MKKDTAGGVFMGLLKNIGFVSLTTVLSIVVLFLPA